MRLLPLLLLWEALGLDGWAVLWVRLLLCGGLVLLAVLLLSVQAFCAPLAAQEQATGSFNSLGVLHWTTRATLS